MNGGRKAMIKIDRPQCLWCGTCVGVCPKYAITLYETRIEIEEGCIDCGLCVKACPVGALSMEEEK